MPLLDHFHPPLSKRRHWANLHSAWANALRDQLNDGLLPPNFVAEVKVTLGNRTEVDVATHEEEPANADQRGGVLLWAPPKAPQEVLLNFTHPELFEVHVYEEEEGPRLVAAIELISPANNDRASQRHMFAVKCGSYLQEEISLVMVDVVTHRSGNLHAQLLRLLDVSHEAGDLTDLYAVAYRTLSSGEAVKMQFWHEPLTVGTPLPTMPLWIAPDMCLPVSLEQAYQIACRSSRIAG